MGAYDDILNQSQTGAYDDILAAGKEKPKKKGSTVKDIVGGLAQSGMGIASNLLRPIEAAIPGGSDFDSGHAERMALVKGRYVNQGYDPESIAFQGGKLAGDIAMTAPIGGGLAKLPMLSPKLATALKTGGLRLGGAGATTAKELAKNVATRIGAGAAVGGTSAGLLNFDTTGEGALIGGALPPVVSLAGSTGRALKAGLIDPLVNQNAIIGNTLVRTVGANNMGQLATRVDPKTAGVNFSLGQRTGAPGIAAIEDTVKAINPGGELSLQSARNREVLANSMRGLAQDENAVAAAIQARKAATTPLYTAASNTDTLADPARVVNLIDRLIEKHPANAGLVNPALQIRESLFQTAGGELRQKPNELMSAIDNIKAMLGKQENSFVRGELNTIKRALEHQLSKAAPEFGQAERTFADMSRPINQMQLGQRLANTFIPSTAGDVPTSLNAASLAKALQNKDQVARLATQFPRARFDKVLTPEQIAMVTGVSDDASRIAEMGRLGAGFGSPTARRQSLSNFVGDNLVNEVPVLSRAIGALGNVPVVNLPIRAAGAVADAVGGKINQNMITKLETMLASNPDEVVKLMQSAATRQAVRQGLKDERIYAPALRALLFAAPASQANLVGQQ